jgi:hypothetical protein
MSVKSLAVKIGLPILLVIGVVRYCDRPVVAPTPLSALAPSDKARVIVRGKTVTTITADKTVKTFAPDGADIRVGKDGKVSVTMRKFGFLREPGLGAAWNGDKLKLAFDLKLAYYRRFGLHFGSVYDPGGKKFKDILRPVAFVSYAMPTDSFANTSLWLGVELFPKKYTAGIRLAF